MNWNSEVFIECYLKLVEKKDLQYLWRLFSQSELPILYPAIKELIFVLTWPYLICPYLRFLEILYIYKASNIDDYNYNGMNNTNGN